MNSGLAQALMQRGDPNTSPGLFGSNNGLFQGSAALAPGMSPASVLGSLGSGGAGNTTSLLSQLAPLLTQSQAPQAPNVTINAQLPPSQVAAPLAGQTVNGVKTGSAPTAPPPPNIIGGQQGPGGALTGANNSGISNPGNVASSQFGVGATSNQGFANQILAAQAAQAAMNAGGRHF